MIGAPLELDSATIRQIDEAVEANLVTHMSWVQSRLDGARILDTPAFLAVDSGLACDTFNFVCRARLDADSAAEAVRFFAETGHPFSWWVGPRDEPAEIGALLAGAGLSAVEADLGMVLDMSRLAGSGGEPAGMEIVRASEPPHIADYASVVAANWNPPDPLVVAFYEAATETLLDPASPIRLYVAYVDGVPVATAEACYAGGVVGLYGIATLTTQRRRGYGSAVTVRALADARCEGVRVGVLQASTEGRFLYARLGFRPHGQYVEYQPDRSA